MLIFFINDFKRILLWYIQEKIFDAVSKFDFKRLERLNEQVLQKLYVTTVI
jgi:hypothetical protein